jgi:hypothetical protein
MQVAARPDKRRDYHPVVGTLDMVMGTPDQRIRGRARGVYMGPRRAVIVPRAELVDDRRLAQLVLAMDRTGSQLLLGHDQSRQTGIVRRRLAAHIADRPKSNAAVPRDGRQPQTIDSLLRSGLLRRGSEAMADLAIVNFLPHQDGRLGDTLPISSCRLL